MVTQVTVNFGAHVSACFPGPGREGGQLELMMSLALGCESRGWDWDGVGEVIVTMC